MKKSIPKTMKTATNQAELDIQRLTLASIWACVTSLQANLPVSADQLKALDGIYEALLQITNEAARGINASNN